jgi:hypothetical protein
MALCHSLLAVGFFGRGKVWGFKDRKFKVHEFISSQVEVEVEVKVKVKKVRHSDAGGAANVIMR